MDENTSQTPIIPLDLSVGTPTQNDNRQNREFIPPKQLIIVGAGTSINEGISKGLWDKIKGKFTIGINFAYKIPFDWTFISFVDCESFYNKYREELIALPLIIGQYNANIEKLVNTIFLKHTIKYNRDIKEGVYQPFLAGVWGLTLGIYLLDVGEIFLLGYDFGTIMEGKDNQNRVISHFYQGQIEHRGVGKVHFYTEQKAKELFDVYKDETKIKIYNVSLQSKINVFEKITYDRMFELLDDETFNQEELRGWIKEKLK